VWFSSYASVQTDKQTNRHTHHKFSHPSWGQNKNIIHHLLTKVQQYISALTDCNIVVANLYYRFCCTYNFIIYANVLWLKLHYLARSACPPNGHILCRCFFISVFMDHGPTLREVDCLLVGRAGYTLGFAAHFWLLLIFRVVMILLKQQRIAITFHSINFSFRTVLIILTSFQYKSAFMLEANICHANDQKRSEQKLIR